MAFRRKTDTGSGEKFSFEKVGQKLQGFYLGTVDFVGDYGPGKKHLFKTTKGVRVVYNQTHLTQLLEGEKPGVMMIATYTGDKQTKKGRNPMKQYTLDIDPEQMLDADEIPDTAEASEESSEPEEYDTAESDEPAEEEDEEPAMDEVKTAPARNIAASSKTTATKASVQAIIDKRRAKSA